METISFLIADDEQFITVALSTLIKKAFPECPIHIADNGNDAWTLIQSVHPKIIISDIGMPGLNGFQLLEKVRNHSTLNDVYFIILTANVEKGEKVKALERGADDYITKPFSMEELLYRIQAILKRTVTANGIKKQDIYNIGRYTFDTVKQLLIIDDQVINLTTKESELLELLCRYGMDILERNFALKTIWVDDDYFNARSMDVYITRLRKYLKKDPEVRILNVHGKGYKLIS